LALIVLFDFGTRLAPRVAADGARSAWCPAACTPLPDILGEMGVKARRQWAGWQLPVPI
jgi:hypothetical protein